MHWWTGDLPLLVASVGLLFFSTTIAPLGGNWALNIIPLQMEMDSSVLLHDLSGQEVLGRGGGTDVFLVQSILPFNVTNYTLQSGDTISEVAQEFDLSIDTLISFNEIENVRRLQAGNSLSIPNQDGIIYKVRPGDSLEKISQQHNILLNDILDANHLKSGNVQAEQVLFLPNVRMESAELRLALGELLLLPAQGSISSYYGFRKDPFTGIRRFHYGMDIANHVGTEIQASDAGRVVYVGTQSLGYGRYLIIRHSSDLQTLYGHLDELYVENGEYVARNEAIGTMGNTGRSTGPHVHFSVIRSGKFVNPIFYLP